MALFGRVAAVICAAFVMVTAAVADSNGTPVDLWQVAMKAAVVGPSDVPLAKEAILHVPPGMAYIPVKESTALMEDAGNSVSDRFRGLVTATNGDSPWTITIDQIADGYVRDEDAKTWNADELLQSLKDGTAEQNTVRKERGIPGLDVLGWIEPPHYDVSAHRLVWSMKVREQGLPAEEASGVNYNTYALGRNGYFEINLITSEKTVAQDKQAAHTVLAALEYTKGNAYSDYVEGTDHVAEYGLAALVAGVAAKKLGLLALGGVFLAKFAKIIIAAVAVAGGGVFKMFKRKSGQAS